jgi:putative ubiquitin-RnfH superfamily antitoxin RatB of RatAB toxin-antitoxin module
MGGAELRIEVVYAAADRQSVKSMLLPSGSSVRDAIRASGLLSEFPGIDLERNRVGIFGEPVDLDRPLADGERVEIYRPLIADPKEARRRRARSGRRR